MRPAGKASRSFSRGRPLKDFVLEPALDERTMLLDLAKDLRRWEVRNQAFRHALDRAALDLVDLAGRRSRS